jgi:hypothetical protein
MHEKEVTEMKKIMLLATMVLAAAFGTAYAYHGSGVWATEECGYQPKNGITVFCDGPASFESVPIETGPMSASYEESSAAGGLREEAWGREPHNGVTIFSYGPVTFEAVPLEAGAMSGTYEESAAAGGLREGEWGKELNNGITDFTGRSYETISTAPEGTGM